MKPPNIRSSVWVPGAEDDPTGVLAFDLQQFTKEQAWPQGQDEDTVTLFTQRDKVHEALKYIIGGAKSSLVMTMYGYDDAELDDLIRNKIEDPYVYVQLALDKSQAGGKTEKEILAHWDHNSRTNNIVVGQSAEHAIAHMKAGVIDGIDVFDGSTNWSLSGEGAQGARAQNNSLVVMRNHAAAVRYRTQLDIDHDVMKQQMLKPKKKAVKRRKA